MPPRTGDRRRRSGVNEDCVALMAEHISGSCSGVDVSALRGRVDVVSTTQGNLFLNWTRLCDSDALDWDQRRRGDVRLGLS